MIEQNNQKPNASELQITTTLQTPKLLIYKEILLKWILITIYFKDSYSIGTMETNAVVDCYHFFY